MRGSGKADVFVMLAHPVRHAKNPGMFNELFEERGLDSLIGPMSCKPEDFDGVGFIDALRAVAHDLEGREAVPIDAGWLVQAPYAQYLQGNPIRT